MALKDHLSSIGVVAGGVAAIAAIAFAKKSKSLAKVVVNVATVDGAVADFLKTASNFRETSRIEDFPQTFSKLDRENEKVVDAIEDVLPVGRLGDRMPRWSPYERAEVFSGIASDCFDDVLKMHYMLQSATGQEVKDVRSGKREAGKGPWILSGTEVYMLTGMGMDAAELGDVLALNANELYGEALKGTNDPRRKTMKSLSERFTSAFADLEDAKDFVMNMMEEGERDPGPMGEFGYDESGKTTLKVKGLPITTKRSG